MYSILCGVRYDSGAPKAGNPPGGAHHLPVDVAAIFDGRDFAIKCRDGEKVDLLEKGFKTQELLFLTEQELEEI